MSGLRRLAVGLVALVAGCAGCAASHGASAPAGPQQPLAAPYVVLSGPQTGLLVWPSGPNWVLLSTTDGFRHVADHTPPAVDTGGGLAVAPDGTGIAVGIGPVERLVRSPLVTAGPSWQWRPGEIPGAVADARASVATAAGAIYAVLRDGRVVALAHGRWTTLTSAARLVRGGGFTPQSVAAAHGVLVVTGHGAAGPAMAYRSTDGGTSWTAVPGTAGTAVAALAPCATPSGPALPVLSGSAQLRLAPIAGGAPGATVRVGPGAVALGCAGATVLVVDAAGQVAASTDGGRHWATRGRAPADLTDLAPTGGGAGFAVSGGSRPQLWRFTGNGAHFVAVPLPAWVARLGGSGGGD